MVWNGTKPRWDVGVDQATAALWNAQARDNIQYTRDTVRKFTKTVLGPSTSWSTGSSSYQDFGGQNYVQIQFRKRQADTFLIYKWRVGCYSDAVDSQFRFGINLNPFGGPVPGDHDGRPYWFNQATTTKTVVGCCGFLPSTALPAMYLATLRVKWQSGNAANIWFNSAVHATITVSEVGVD